MAFLLNFSREDAVVICLCIPPHPPIPVVEGWASVDLRWLSKWQSLGDKSSCTALARSEPFIWDISHGHLGGGGPPRSTWWHSTSNRQLIYTLTPSVCTNPGTPLGGTDHRALIKHISINHGGGGGGWRSSSSSQSLSPSHHYHYIWRPQAERPNCDHPSTRPSTQCGRWCRERS